MAFEFGIIAGLKASCPFCLARSKGAVLPEVGQQVTIINGFSPGQTGIVTKLQIPIPGEKGFLIRPEGDPPEIELMVRLSSERYLPSAEFKAPKWFPPFGDGEIAGLEQAVVEFCNASYAGGKWNWNRHKYLKLVHLIWRMRLPISEAELWAMLGAHGVPDQEYSRAITMFQDGLWLLIYANGRKPIKKKRF